MNRTISLNGNSLPDKWYNLQADLPSPLPPYRHPGTGEPLSPDDLAPLFAAELIQQEVSRERWIDIPETVREKLGIWRPTPLVRAIFLEEALGTPARIYYKNESVSPAGSHKPNSAMAQAYFNSVEGITSLATETGAGQWGSSLAFACAHFNLDCKVFMVRISYDQKPYRRTLMETWGAKVFPSPSSETRTGRQILSETPDSTGSLGMAISEAVEAAVGDEQTHYALGSVLNHVCLHQSVIGLETKEQLKMVDEEPDVIIGCAGGGSNFCGIASPFIPDKLSGQNIRFVATEPSACPTLTRGKYAYDFGDLVGAAPLTPMLTLGHSFVPAGIHAGGLRYHGMSPLISALCQEGLVESVAYDQRGVFEAALLFARTEGILPAPETAHAIKGVVDEAYRCKKEKRSDCIVFNLSGHGHFDLTAYQKFLAGDLADSELSESDLNAQLESLPRGPTIDEA